MRSAIVATPALLSDSRPAPGALDGDLIRARLPQADTGFKVLPVVGASPAEKASPALITMRPAARGKNIAFMLTLLRLWLLPGKRGDRTPAAR